MDKVRDARNLEHLQACYVGVGHADTHKHEFITNVHRDTLSSLAGHPALLHYTALGCGRTREQMRVQLLERMIRPIGPPPKDEGVGSDHLIMRKAALEQVEEERKLKELAARERKEKRAREAGVWAKK